MWVAKDREQPNPEVFDKEHLRREYLHTDEDLITDQLRLIGRLDGISLLDLGGGRTLAKHIATCKSYLLIDYSEVGCRLAMTDMASKIIAGVHRFKSFGYQVTDVLQFLLHCKECGDRFDITSCFGLVEYLPPTFLRQLFELTPSAVLALGTSSGESYLQYPTRLVSYSRDDVVQTAVDTGWRIANEIPFKSHVYIRFERE